MSDLSRTVRKQFVYCQLEKQAPSDLSNLKAEPALHPALLVPALQTLQPGLFFPAT